MSNSIIDNQRDQEIMKKPEKKSKSIIWASFLSGAEYLRRSISLNKTK